MLSSLLSPRLFGSITFWSLLLNDWPSDCQSVPSYMLNPVYNNAALVQLCSFYEFEINLIVRVNKHSSRLRTAAYPVVIRNPF